MIIKLTERGGGDRYVESADLMTWGVERWEEQTSEPGAGTPSRASMKGLEIVYKSGSRLTFRNGLEIVVCEDPLTVLEEMGMTALPSDDTPEEDLKF